LISGVAQSTASKQPNPRLPLRRCRTAAFRAVGGAHSLVVLIVICHLPLGFLVNHQHGGNVGGRPINESTQMATSINILMIHTPNRLVHPSPDRNERSIVRGAVRAPPSRSTARRQLQPAQRSGMGRTRCGTNTEAERLTRCTPYEARYSVGSRERGA